MCDYASYQEAPKDSGKETPPPRDPYELYQLSLKLRKQKTSTGTDLLEDSFR